MNTLLTFKHIETPGALHAAYPVMKELRPHLASAEAFVEQVETQRKESYRLLGAFDGERLLGLAGYRHVTNLLYGRFVYVDDLVVAADNKRGGAGSQLLNEVKAIAREAGCANFVLDTGLHMPLAQRFYFRNGLLAKGMHFVEPLTTSREASR
ncbi:GNAT family N-acetyltransferase [Pandoraea sputorum]|uniref:GNAT family N-acetyltransferase n=1 Tax=Pandoraea sputorum TaxID=93222 RepID=UPI001240AAE1|nr:GNAT family N-acetyltransferase [Pandoraea sputorum]BET13271.1 GNAT family N-acetyltransferase [Pandoraea sputorum]VVE82069.1 GCN5 family acetyltransferase [Pandoraea sputorum]